MPNESVQQKMEDEVHRMMAKRFENFEIIEKMRHGVYRSWNCCDKNRNNWDSWFTITTIPGSLIITGDLGDLIVSRVYDMLPWCRRSCHSTSYFLEKVPRTIPTTEFSHERLREWILEEIDGYKQLQDLAFAEQISEIKSKIKFLEGVLSDGVEDDGEAFFARLLEDYWRGDDYPNWHVPIRRILILREAVRWFVENHSEPTILEEPD